MNASANRYDDPQGSVWCFETGNEDVYSHSLSVWIQEVIDNPSEKGIEAIRSLWDNEDSWETIVRRFNTEGSVWIVWWLDGVRKYMSLDEEVS